VVDSTFLLLSPLLEKETRYLLHVLKKKKYREFLE
jgi:hypothetical protein